MSLTSLKIDLAKELVPPKAAVSASDARWVEIEKHISSTREAEWKFAVIEADKLVDELLKGAGFQGDTMGERLMNIQPGQLTTLQGLWEAHKIRNRLVHDTNYFLRYTEAKRTVMFALIGMVVATIASVLVHAFVGLLTGSSTP